MTRLPVLILAAALLAPAIAFAQTPASPKGTAPGIGAQGQQRNQPIPDLNQSQLKSDRSEQPPEVTATHPEAGAHRPPEPTLTR